MKLPVIAVFAFGLSAGLAQAEPVRQGNLEIDAAWARASIGTSRPGAAAARSGSGTAYTPAAITSG